MPDGEAEPSPSGATTAGGTSYRESGARTQRDRSQFRVHVLMPRPVS
eukprot:tig00001366_g8375.t1